MMRQFEAPKPRDCRTKSDCFMVETCARTIRETSIQEVSPMISEIERMRRRDECRDDEQQEDLREAQQVSTKRISRLSTHPP